MVVKTGGGKGSVRGKGSGSAISVEEVEIVDHIPFSKAKAKGAAAIQRTQPYPGPEVVPILNTPRIPSTPDEPPQFSWHRNFILADDGQYYFVRGPTAPNPEYWLYTRAGKGRNAGLAIWEVFQFKPIVGTNFKQLTKIFIAAIPEATNPPETF